MKDENKVPVPSPIRDNSDDTRLIEKSFKSEEFDGKELDKMNELMKRNQVDIEKLKDAQIKLMQDLDEKFKSFEIKNERVKKIIEDMYMKYEKIQKDTLRSDLSETIKSATLAYEKFADSDLKSAAKGLALAAMLKLHAEIDKI
jgi:hypothetical protein